MPMNELAPAQRMFSALILGGLFSSVKNASENLDAFVSASSFPRVRLDDRRAFPNPGQLETKGFIAESDAWVELRMLSDLPK